MIQIILLLKDILVEMEILLVFLVEAVEVVLALEQMLLELLEQQLVELVDMELDLH